jgi:hypothetical protein
MTASTPLVLYDVELIDMDVGRQMLIFLAEEGLILTRTPRCNLWQVGAIGCLRLQAGGEFHFHPYVDPRLRRAADLDDPATNRWGWRLDALRFQVKAGITPGLIGQVQKEDVQPLILEVPREFLDVCAAYGVAPAAALRAFIADLCALENRHCCPREDGYSSNGSDERLLVRQYWTRTYEPNADGRTMTLDSVDEFVSWTRMRDW